MLYLLIYIAIVLSFILIALVRIGDHAAKAAQIQGYLEQYLYRILTER